jgi:hypothetical protein
MSITSSFVDLDTPDQRSIKYQNLFVIDGVLTYLTTNHALELPYVSKWTNSYYWKPAIKTFSTQKDIDEYITSMGFQTIALGLLGDVEWYGNIAHALFDGIYPSYLALVKFGKWSESFVALVGDMSNKKTLAYEVLKTFSGNEVLEYQKFTPDTKLHFKEVVAGTGKTGNRIMNEEYTLYGKKYNGMELFRRRMLERHHVSINLPLRYPINIGIIDNKRYNKHEREQLNQVFEFYQGLHGCNVKMIDWAKYPTFESQMAEIADLDIQVSGPGTGMLYMPFMKKGAVSINLGYMEHSQTNDSRPNIKIADCPYDDFIFPGYMEQSVCASVENVSTLFYDRSTHNDIEFLPLVVLIDEAIALVMSEKILECRHNVDAMVFKEYCRRSGHGQAIAEYLTNKAFFIELFVHEHPFAIAPFTNLELLRQIKDEMRLDRRYEYGRISNST